MGARLDPKQFCLRDHRGDGAQDLPSTTESPPHSPLLEGHSPIPAESGCPHRLPLRLLCETMKRQIVSRAFYGCECGLKWEGWGSGQAQWSQSPCSPDPDPHRAGVLPPPIHSTDPPVSTGASQHHPTCTPPRGLRRPHQGRVEQVPER